MKTVSWDEFLDTGYPGNHSGYAASIGSFDGVHLGHLRLLETLTARARDGLDGSAVITFRDNPKRILRPEMYLGDISSLRQRLERIAGAGIDLCVLIDYDQHFGAMTGMRFLDILRTRTRLGCLVMGQNARLGINASMDAVAAVAYAKEMGVDAQTLPSLVLDGKIVSSSRIRNTVISGDTAEAGRMLGYPYELDLEGWRIEGKGADFELNAPEKRQILPRSGAFEVEWLDQGGTWRKAGLEMRNASRGMRLFGVHGLPSRLRFV
jgi:riboflavin kinase / FMN adenylyltransferase